MHCKHLVEGRNISSTKSKSLCGGFRELIGGKDKLHSILNALLLVSISSYKEEIKVIQSTPTAFQVVFFFPLSLCSLFSGIFPLAVVVRSGKLETEAHKLFQKMKDLL